VGRVDAKKYEKTIQEVSMGVCIQLDNNFYITSDKHGYQLSKFQGYDKSNKEMWKPEKFAGTIRSLLESWAELEVRTSGAQSFEELKAKVDEMHAKINEIGPRVSTARSAAASD
jgi:hypothetical protein